jgi:hypothetical protein
VELDAVIPNRTRNDESSQSTENNFDPRLKKSLYLVDSFLHDIHNIYFEGVSKPEIEPSSQTSPSPTAAIKGIMEAWTVFCREHDTDGLVIPDPSGIICNDIDETDSTSKELIETNAARLGQYFASDENAKDVSALWSLELVYHPFLPIWYVSSCILLNVGGQHCIGVDSEAQSRQRAHHLCRTIMWRWTLNTGAHGATFSIVR